MTSPFKRVLGQPIYLLLAANILAGLLVFRDYGLSWDEPLFYDYGKALGYAYSPREWLSGQFDLENSYGPSGDDHKTRGPAYLLLARGPVLTLEGLGVDHASAWHLTNFLFFQAGVYFLYRLARRWISVPAALGAAALFAWQPLLWGHAFVNPKDPPFLTFFLASVCLGFEMVDRLAGSRGSKGAAVLLPAIVLGITASIRVLGPLAGVLVVVYAAVQGVRTGDRRGSTPRWRSWILYGVVAILTMFATWPYLWESPLQRFLEVFRFMSDNPTSLAVLFNGDVFRAGELPRRYLPVMLAITLTEPVWILFLLGILTGLWSLPGDRSPAKWSRLTTATLVFAWFAILVGYVLIRRPAMYDGFRHFLFILPPVFIFSGFAFEFLINRLGPPSWLYAGLILVCLLPGLLAIARLHPYQYTYYNSFVGGTRGAFRQFETDYWLTCYKEAVQELHSSAPGPVDLFVHREAYIAGYYAGSGMSVRDLRGAASQVGPGDYVLVNTRTNEDRRVFKEAPSTIEIRREGALFCTIKRIP